MLQKTIAPILYSIITKSDKGSTDFYTILQTNELKTHSKWEVSLNKQLSIPEWKLIHRSCFKTVNDNYLSYLQYKIINSILGTRSLLYKLSITNNNPCTFCTD